MWGFEIVRDTAFDADAQAGAGPGDLDVLEVHDAFTIGEIVTTEALGLGAEGEGAKLLTGGHTALGGAQPVNPPVGCCPAATP